MFMAPLCHQIHAFYLTSITNLGKLLFMIRNIIIITLLLLTRCGWIDNDGTDYLIDVVGDIKIEKRRGDNTIRLVLGNDNPAQTFVVIAEDCARVYYDSIKSKIYIEEYSPEVNGFYTQINIIDASESTPYKAFKAERISKKDFESYLRSVNGPRWNFPK